MPRMMPRLDLQFAANADRCVAIAKAGELVYAASLPGSIARNEFHPARLEGLYELAYLRVFIEWEDFLEAAFLRYMCGHHSRHGPAVMAGGVAFQRSLAAAQAAMLGGNAYVLWYPKKVIDRARIHFVGSLHESVVLAAKADLDLYTAVRHRIAHGQDNARANFDAATMTLSAKRYRGSRPGAFLRDWDGGIHWLESITNSLKGIAGLVV
jgi:hypothetical protein